MPKSKSKKGRNRNREGPKARATRTEEERAAASSPARKTSPVRSESEKSGSAFSTPTPSEDEDRPRPRDPINDRKSRAPIEVSSADEEEEPSTYQTGEAAIAAYLSTNNLEIDHQTLGDGDCLPDSVLRSLGNNAPHPGLAALLRKFCCRESV